MVEILNQGGESGDGDEIIWSSVATPSTRYAKVLYHNLLDFAFHRASYLQ